MRIAICQLNPVIGAIKENVNKIVQEISNARSIGIDCIIFPELAICGYPPEDLLLQQGFIEEVEKGLDRIVKECKDISCIVGTPRINGIIQDKPLCNSAAVIVNGTLKGFQDKALLPTYDVFDERRYFHPAAQEIIWEISGKRVGITICEDIWPNCGLQKQQKYQYDPLCIFDNGKIDLLINISASPYSAGKIETRTEVVKNIAKRLNCNTILCNQIGGQDGLIFDGSSLVASSKGDTILQAKSFEEDLIIFDTEIKYNIVDTVNDRPREIFSALVLGLRDYFTKQGFNKACLGLSGGIDSALVATIATAALGKENVLGVLLPSRFTSSESTEDAFHLASNLDISTIEVPIETPFEAYLDTLLPVLGEKKSFDIIEENLQSRVRGMLLMSISNKFGYLLLNTGNKSEVATGYTTLYGDSCGAISVIGDLLKGDVYELSRWISKHFGWIPQRTITREPSAELRENQRDSDTLPEYPILDLIIQEYVVEQRSNEEISKKHGFQKELVDDVISKINRNEYKRRQLPFALRISDKCFSSGRRMQIVQNFSTK